MKLGEIYSDIFRLKAISKSMNSMLGKMLIGLFSLLCTLVFKFWLGYLILKQIHATSLMWWLYWISIPGLLLLDWIKNQMDKLGTNADRLTKSTDDISRKYPKP